MSARQPTAPAEPLEDRHSLLFEGVPGRIVDYMDHHAIKPGARLPPERTLAAELGVSRSSVREGLTVLRVFGLLDIRHGNGIRVIRDIDDVVPPISALLAVEHPHLPAVGEIQPELEAIAARLATKRRTERDLGAMAAAIGQMEREIAAGESGLTADRAFHRAVDEAAHNPVLTAVLRTVADAAAEIARASLARAGQPERSLATHRDIFEAIAVRNAEDAGRLMRDHLTITGEIDPA
jgi:GntR family transcriptional repressor for pyruvate dehydrogenase complex